jgi:hypothetical protein
MFNFSFLTMSQFDLPITQKKKETMDALQTKRFYLEVWNSLPWRTTFAKAYGIKLKCYWKLFGEHVRNLGTLCFEPRSPPPPIFGKFRW